MWNMSYSRIKAESGDTALLFKRWAFLDYGNMWYELIAHAAQLEKFAEMPGWLTRLANDELQFYDAMGVLPRYSLVDQQDGTVNGDPTTYTIHQVVHK
jgi:hypothetical protein